MKFCFIAILICLISLQAFAQDQEGLQQELVVRVVDGDTLRLANAKIVQLIGVNTPEMHATIDLYREAERKGQDVREILALGERSYQFTKQLAEGKDVLLEFDAQKYDKYGNILAYAYLCDGTFINAEIIKQGYAGIKITPPNVKYADLFRELYQQAQQSRKGLWE